MRTFAKLGVCLFVAGAVAWPALPTSWSQGVSAANAQAGDPVRIAAAKKKTPAKSTPKEQPKEAGRTPFTSEEQAAAAIPDIPDARVWGDSDADFQRVLPTASGPWLALSGGGADGAFGAGLHQRLDAIGQPSRIRGRDRGQHRRADLALCLPRAAL